MYKANRANAFARVEQRFLCSGVVQTQPADIYNMLNIKQCYRVTRRAHTVVCSAGHHAVDFVYSCNPLCGVSNVPAPSLQPSLSRETRTVTSKNMFLQLGALLSGLVAERLPWGWKALLLSGISIGLIVGFIPCSAFAGGLILGIVIVTSRARFVGLTGGIASGKVRLEPMS
jgi:hypothetical protein